MNYWLLTSEYPPFFGGGISTYCQLTARMLSQNGHQVSVFINDAAVGDVAIEEREGIRIVRFNPSRTKSEAFLGYTTNISYEFAAIVKQFIENGETPDLIEAQEYLGIAYYLLHFKRLGYAWCQAIPVVITMHSPSFLYMEYNHVPQYRFPNYWICEMERFCLQAADLVISPSRFMIRELEKRFRLTNPNLTVIANPFSAKAEQEAFAGAVHKGEIVFFGKLTVQKGAFKLLTYFKELWDEGFSRPLYVVGGQDIVYHPEGKDMGDLVRTRYQKYIAAGLLRLEDRLPPSEAGQRLARAEVVVVPSMNDNLPYVVLEMMALGKIVLVSQQGGHAEIVEDGTDGFIFDHERPDTFAKKLHAILALSEADRNRISTNARQKVKSNYRFEAIYAQKIATLAKVVSSGITNDCFPFIRPSAHDVLAPAAGALLSVVIPYYNMGAYIEETVQSVRAALYEPKEILIINDGSTEQASIAALERYRHMDGVRVFDTPNKGLAAARNQGADLATGAFLAFLDADDKVAPTYYTKAIHVLRQYSNVHFVGCWTQYFDASSQTWPTFTPEPPLILYHNEVNSSALVYKRASFLAAGKNDRNMLFQGLEDYESVIALISAGCHGVVLPEALFYYRVRRHSMMRQLSKTKKLLLYQYITLKHNGFYATFAAEILNLLTANGPGIHIDNPTLDYHLFDRVPFGGKALRKLISLSKKNKIVKRLAYGAYKFINR